MAEKNFDSEKAQAIRSEVMKYVYDVMKSLETMKSKYNDRRFDSDEDCTRCFDDMREFIKTNNDRLDDAMDELRNW